jgi:hypothetical protein
MQHFFTETLGISDNIFGLVVLPIFIFIARIADVSINTIRIIYVLGGRRMTSTILGFIESLIWLLAIRQIFEHLDNWAAYIAYPAGFASGILVGMILEERIAYGKVIVRIITSTDGRADLVWFAGRQCERPYERGHSRRRGAGDAPGNESVPCSADERCGKLHIRELGSR